jgi:hypothetical protein
LGEGVLRSGAAKSVFVLSLTRLHAQDFFFNFFLSFQKLTSVQFSTHPSPPFENSMVRYLVYSSPPLAPNLSQISPVHTPVTLAAHSRSNTETDGALSFTSIPLQGFYFAVFFSTET